MKIGILSTDTDNVISSLFVTGITNYQFAIDNFIPLIDKLDIQRRLQDSKFYQRLERDLINGCIMPPITIAIVKKDYKSIDSEDIAEFINNEIENAFILDGIQRLNTLKRTYLKHPEKLNLQRNIYLNILICSSMDNLLYRMITLNNGQKPMSARHQIEILSTNMIDFVESDIPVVTEKETSQLRIKVFFNKDSFIKGYLAYLSNSTNIENKKIIEEKMDMLVADKIMDTELKEGHLEFSEVINLINKLSQNPYIFRWLKNANNLIGFCVGVKTNFDYLASINIDSFEKALVNYEKAFASFDYSQIKVGRYRKNLAKYYIENFERLQKAGEYELIDELSQID